MQKVIDKIFDYYLIQNHHYLIQLKDGRYVTKADPKRRMPLHHLQGHLKGNLPIGTFAGKYLTKFICFDVDFRDAETAKWVTYKIAHALDEVGLQKYAISFSGNKGYHIELFYDKALSVAASRQFFDYIVYQSELSGIEGGEVEFRPSGTQGVKLPLGNHQKTGNFCGFCDVSDGLRVMDREESFAHFIALKKTDHAAVLDIIADRHAYDSRAASDMENAISRHKPLAIYDQSESYTLSHAADRYNNGMTGPGQRHKSFLLLARLMNHNGVERVDALSAITDWFAWQDKRLYTTDHDACVKDLRECVDFVYDNDKTLIVEQRDLTVTFSEIDAIIRKCPLKSQKAIAYALLVHSKRWGNGIFYMSYAQIMEAAGVDDNTVGRHLDNLERFGAIVIISRNQKQKGTHLKKPNVYRMTLITGEITDERSYEVIEDESIGGCVKHFYTDKEIRKILSRRQSDAVLTVS